MNRKSIGRFSIAVMMAVLIVTSTFAPFVGALGGLGLVDQPTQQEKQIIGEAEAIGDDLDCASTATALLSMGSGRCLEAGGLLAGPADADSTVELEESVFVEHGAMQEMHFRAENDFKNYLSGADDDTESLAVLAFAEGEGAIVEARYNDESKATAEAEARLAAADEYAQAYKSLIGDSSDAEYSGMHNEMWQTFTTWSAATNTSDDAQQVMSLNLSSEGTAFMWSGQFSATDSTEIIYETRELANGEEIEYVAGLKDVAVVSQNELYSDAGLSESNVERVDLNFVMNAQEHQNRYGTNADEDPYIVPEFHTSTGQDFGNFDGALDDPQYGAGSMSIDGTDPNSAETESIDLWTSNPLQWIYSDYQSDSLETDRNSVNTKLETRVDEIYNQVAAGELSPDEYWGPEKFYGEYGSSLGQSVAADLYWSQHLGATVTDPATQMVVTHPVSADSPEEYEGGLVMTGSQAPLVYDDQATPINSNGDISLQSPSHKSAYTVNDSGNVVIEFSNNSDYSDSNVYIDVINADSADISRSSGTITATVAEGDLQNEFILYETYVMDGSGNEVDRSSTYVNFGSSDTTEVRGFVVGSEYDTTVDMIYIQGSGETARTTLDQTWSFDSNFGADGNEQAVAVVETGVDRNFSGTSVTERVDQQETVQKTIENNEYVTVESGSGGPLISVGGDGLLGGLGDLLPDFNSGLILLVGGVLFFIPIVLFVGWKIFLNFTPWGRTLKTILGL